MKMTTTMTPQMTERYDLYYSEALNFLTNVLKTDYDIHTPIDKNSTLDSLGIDSLDRLELDTIIYKRYPQLERVDADYKYSGLDRLLGNDSLSDIADAIAYSIHKI